MPTTTDRGRSTTAAEREDLAVDYARRYADGETIRSIADDVGRSYGFVYRVLNDAGVTFRARGRVPRANTTNGDNGGGAA